jgi:hypothetical protein
MNEQGASIIEVLALMLLGACTGLAVLHTTLVVRMVQDTTHVASTASPFEHCTLVRQHPSIVRCHDSSQDVIDLLLSDR